MVAGVWERVMALTSKVDANSISAERFGLAALLLAGFLIAAGCDNSPFGPKQYSGSDATVRVVDSEGKPVSGAIAIMYWSYMEPNGHSEHVFDVMEVEADSNGVIRVPGRGPIITPIGTRMLPHMPQLRVFKPGYLPVFDQNVTGEYWEEAPPSMPLKWDGQTITLVAVDPQSERYLDQIQALARSMDFFLAPKQCWSVTFHRMIDVVNVELDEYMPQDVAGRKIRPNLSGCESVESADSRSGE
jgi:hypothetical protein